ncbi:ribonuclease P protein component [Winogradskyella sp. D23]|uniref:Ribonuclease P protein component n=1 Tax=Winogradskyella alexanderae TaxID=2877123 RepID=A0ABS7XMP3_9FLAO|nr:ribonuclease P protein component [Winogradskyella alexanderae]MCA0131253.1 ribonuclease P protein component [Winogradskyella alexanderae]
MSLKYGKKDKLKSKKLIEQLFAEGDSLTVFPLRLVYLKTNFNDNNNLKAGVSVSKKLHKTAVSRNRIKRLIREAYRLNKSAYFNNSSTSYALMILYIGKKGTTFDEINETMKKLFQKFLDKTLIK